MQVSHTKLVLVLAMMCATFALGCKGKKSKTDKQAVTQEQPQKPTPAPRPILKVTQLADAMCACTNTLCAKQASRTYMKWMRAEGKLRVDNQKRRKITEQQRRLNDCLKHALR